MDVPASMEQDNIALTKLAVFPLPCTDHVGTYLRALPGRRQFSVPRHWYDRRPPAQLG